MCLPFSRCFPHFPFSSFLGSSIYRSSLSFLLPLFYPFFPSPSIPLLSPFFPSSLPSIPSLLLCTFKPYCAPLSTNQPPRPQSRSNSEQATVVFLTNVSLNLLRSVYPFFVNRGIVFTVHEGVLCVLVVFCFICSPILKRGRGEEAWERTCRLLPTKTR